MPFTLATAHGIALSSSYNELSGYFNGLSGYPANPIQLLTYNDPTLPVLTLKNLDQAVGGVVKFLRYDGTVLMEVHKSGFRYSSDGVTADLVPVSISGNETITGNKTFTGTVTIGGVAWARGASTASAAALTLPASGNVIPVTGTVTITSIVGTASPMVLEFASVGCKVTAGASLILDGDFVSGLAGATLLLEYDGSAWHELARRNAARQGALCPAAGQTLNSGAALAPVALGTATYDRYGFKVGNTLKAVWAGTYQVSGSIQIEQDGSSVRGVSIFKNGTAYAVVGSVYTPGGGVDAGCSWSFPLSLAADDVIDLRARSSNNNLLVRTSSFLALDYRGRA